MRYGYCRISKEKQSIERQIRNIKTAFPEAVIVQEVFTLSLIHIYLFPDILAIIHIFRYDEHRKDGITYEIHSENTACTYYVGYVYCRAHLQTGAQTFLDCLCTGLYPVSCGKHISLYKRLCGDRLHRSGDCISALALRFAKIGHTSCGMVYSYADTAQGKNLRISETINS